MMNVDNIYASIPYDISIKIVSYLPVRDVCVLGSCSKFWRELCASDTIWFALTTQRWPSLNLTLNVNSQFSDLASGNSQMAVHGWKSFYTNRHHDIEEKVSAVVQFVEQSSSSVSLEARDYLKALKVLRSIQLEYQDVELFIFKEKLNVLLNLLGLHYCIDWLHIPLECVMDTLRFCKIAERQVSIKWWKLGQWLYGQRQRDESHYRLLSMADLVTEKHEVLGVLSRGAIYEVMRIQISVAYPRSEPWTCQIAV